jgi:hypothetical protein
VKVGAHPIYTEAAYQLESVRASVGTAPVGSAVIVDVNKNGVSIYGTPGNRPQIAAGTKTGAGGVASGGSFVAGDIITVDIDAVGSTTPGSDLTVVVRLRRSP